MAFGRVQLACQDAPVTFTDVNQLVDNGLAVRDLLAAEHGALESWRGVSPPPTARLGHHNTPKIPRAVLNINPTTLSYGLVVPGLANTLPSVVPQVQRSATGLYVVTVSYLSRWWAVCYPKQTSSTPMRLVRSAPLYPSSTTTSAALQLETYELSSGDFALTDYEFGVILYGTT